MSRVETNLGVETESKISWGKFALVYLLDIRNISQYLKIIDIELDNLISQFKQGNVGTNFQSKLSLIQKQVGLMGSLMFHSGDEKNNLLNSIKSKLEFFSN